MKYRIELRVSNGKGKDKPKLVAEIFVDKYDAVYKAIDIRDMIVDRERSKNPNRKCQIWCVEVYNSYDFETEIKFGITDQTRRQNDETTNDNTTNCTKKSKMGRTIFGHGVKWLQNVIADYKALYELCASKR